MENLTGKQLGPYQVLGPLGEGGMAAVYKAFQPGVERDVALKILPRHLAKDEAFVARFKREAKVLAQLQHPHILQVFDYGEADGYTYIVMPLVKSGTLAALLKGEPLPFDQVEKIMGQLGDALDYAHSMGIIHRDLKPSNVLIDERGNCLLTDFGIAKIVEGNDDLTKTGSIIGTPAYMSPEQGQGGAIDARSDIYSLGIILYELLTGRVPFKAETPLAVMVKHLNDPLPLPRQRNPNLPEAAERVILKTLTKRPEDRYDTAGAATKALSLALQGADPGDTAIDYKDQAGTMISRQEAEFRPTIASTSPPATSTARRSPGMIIAIVLVLVAVIGGGVILFGGAGTEPPEPTPTAPLIAQVTEAPTATPSPLPTNTAVPTNTPVPTNTAVPTNTPVPTSTSYPTLTPSPTTVIDTEFPLPDDVQQFFKAANSEQIFFQTDLDLDTLLAFYRAEFTGAGLTERELLTTLFDGGFSIVFDGAANGQAVVVQATDLGQSSPTDKRTIVIRYEEI